MGRGRKKATTTKATKSEAGSLGRARNTTAQVAAAKANGKLGGRPAEYACRCGASGRDVARWKYKGILHTKCRVCGKRG